MWAEACALLDEAERKHRHFFELLAMPSARPVWEPPADIFAEGPELQVVVALPGARAEEIAVQLTAQRLADRNHGAAACLSARGVNVVRLEIPYGRMRRRIDIPPGRYVLVERRLDRGCLFLRLTRETRHEHRRRTHHIARARTVLFPGVVLPISIAGNLSLAAAQEAVRTQRRVGLLLQDEAAADAGEAPEGLHRVGTTATIVRFITAQDGTHHLIAQGDERFTVLDYVSREPFLVARIETHKEPSVLDREIEARGLNLREKAMEAVQLLPQAPGELVNAIRAIESIPALADMVASFMDLKPRTSRRSWRPSI